MFMFDILQSKQCFEYNKLLSYKKTLLFTFTAVDGRLIRIRTLIHIRHCIHGQLLPHFSLIG